ncbi:hypothetical protein EYF80_009177 [Liparis tanakae]|uniref:Uncharacterized protein n=1 Tax=Liparis tanakae TaxID=230148 RepID=A0A4Z2IRN1_9TELE|nr:hypothetical protein EYF80_009177 [Liparis tanakae]
MSEVERKRVHFMLFGESLSGYMQETTETVSLTSGVFLVSDNLGEAAYNHFMPETSESSSNRIVQRTSWSKEWMLGLRNRSIFILLSVLFQLLMSADPQTGLYAPT